MTQENLIRQEQLKKLRGLPPPQADVQPLPPMSQQPYIMAEQLRQQAEPQKPRQEGLGRTLGRAALEGIVSQNHPGGYLGWQADQAAQERQRQQDLYARAKDFQQQGFQREQLFQQGQESQLGREAEQNRFNQTMGLRQQELGLKERELEQNRFASGAQGIYSQKTGELIKAAPSKPENINQPIDLEVPGQKAPVSGYFDETMRKWRNVDTGAVLEGAHAFHQPAASIQLMGAQEQTVPGWVELVKTGQAQLIEVPYNIRSKVADEVQKSGSAIVPKDVRVKLTDISQARNLLKPIRKAMDEIRAGKDTVQNSALMEQYSRSIGTLLARSMGERGVVTDQDVARAIGIVPGWKATNFAPSYAEKEWEWLKGIIDTQENAWKAGYFQEVEKPEAGAPKTNANPEAERTRIKF